MNDTRKALRDIIAARAFQFGDFVLSTGKKSSYYFDCKRVTLHPEGASHLADLYLDEIAKLPAPVDAIGGLILGADPIVGAVMMRGLERGVRLESFYVRKEAKQHGTKAWIENPPREGCNIVIVDDVVTTGSSVIKAIDRTQDAYNIVAVICVVDRLQDGGAERIRERCKNYVALYDMTDFPEAQSGASPLSVSG